MKKKRDKTFKKEKIEWLGASKTRNENVYQDLMQINISNWLKSGCGDNTEIKARSFHSSNTNSDPQYLINFPKLH